MKVGWAEGGRRTVPGLSLGPVSTPTLGTGRGSRPGSLTSATCIADFLYGPQEANGLGDFYVFNFVIPFGGSFIWVRFNFPVLWISSGWIVCFFQSGARTAADTGWA